MKYILIYLYSFVNLCIHYELYVPVSHNIWKKSIYTHKLYKLIGVITLLFSKND